MPTWLNLDWHGMFVPSKPILETVIRGTATYLSLFVLLRMFRRQTGSLGPADLLVLLLLADASQNAMAGEYRAITDGLILVATIMGWEYLLDFLSFRIPAIAKIVEREPLEVIKNGEINKEHLRRELMTEDELMSQLRQKGVDDTKRVKSSFIEGDGNVSVITDEQSKPAQSQGGASGVDA
jgi:uncharacterized membrane protein YcaP (DUF421 family)